MKAFYQITKEFFQQMAYPIGFMLFWTIVGLILTFILSSCTETIYEEVIKLDTVFVSKPQSFAPTFITVRDTIVIHDTLKIETVITKYDTILQVVTKDSLIIKEVEKIVYHTDTVEIVKTVVNNVHTTDTVIVVQHDTVTLTEYETRIVYLNTEYIYIFPGQDAHYIPEPFMPHYLSFIAEANARNKQLPGGSVVLTQVDPSDLTGEGWVSESWEIAGFQWVIRISDALTVEESRSAIYRELGRMQLSKKYSNDINKIMSPLFDPSRTVSKLEIDELFKI